MKMTTIKIQKAVIRKANGLAWLMTAILFFSCTDFFETESDSLIKTEGQVYKEELQMRSGLFGLLQGLQQIGDNYVLMGELRGDLMTTTANSSQELHDIEDFTADSTNSYLKQRDYYALINNCNYYIQHLDTAATKLVNGASNKYALPYLAQAKAIRAWTYLQLCLDYGKVIYTTEPVLDSENITGQQTVKLDALLPLLINDVSNAIQYLPRNAVSADQWTSGATDPGFTSSTSFDSYAAKQLLLPLHFVLGELYLWQEDFQNAVEQYYYLIYNDRLTTGNTYRNQYDTTGENISTTRWANQFSGFDYADIISAIVFGTSSDLVNSNLYTMANNNYTIAPSGALQDIFDSQFYYTGNRTINGDLRGAYGTYKKVTTTTNTSETTDTYITKYNNMRISSVPYISLCRTALIYLRYAECCNRLGKPKFVFNGFLKYGLSAENLGSIYANAFAGEDNSAWWMDFGQNNLDATSGSTEYFKTNTIGFHARGCGRTELNETYAIEEQATLKDSIEWVENQLMNEYALETALEGNRFHDLMRIARFRKDPTYLAEKVSAKFPASQKSRIYTLLSDEDNWYLPSE